MDDIILSPSYLKFSLCNCSILLMHICHYLPSDSPLLKDLSPISKQLSFICKSL